MGGDLGAWAGLDGQARSGGLMASGINQRVPTRPTRMAKLTKPWAGQRAQGSSPKGEKPSPFGIHKLATDVRHSFVRLFPTVKKLQFDETERQAQKKGDLQRRRQAG